MTLENDLELNCSRQVKSQFTFLNLFISLKPDRTAYMNVYIHNPSYAQIRVCTIER
jgi:hypothetical protein